MRETVLACREGVVVARVSDTGGAGVGRYRIGVLGQGYELACTHRPTLGGANELVEWLLEVCRAATVEAIVDHLAG